MGKITGIIAAGSLLLAFGCASSQTGKTGLLGSSSNAATTKLASSDKVPAADGEVKVSDEKNNNTKIDLMVQHLAAPQKIDPSATTYVVWEVPANQDNAQPQNIGALNVDPKLTGRLQTVTPLRSFDLFVTAENTPAATQPSGDKLLWTTVSR